MDPYDLKHFFHFVSKDKPFMNEIIEYLSNSKGQFSAIIMAYVIEKYEPDYHGLLNNIFVNG